MPGVPSDTPTGAEPGVVVDPVTGEPVPATPDGQDPSEIGATPNTGEVAPSHIPARLRRMTRAEYATTVNELLGLTATSAEGFVPDTRQSGFTRNAAQIVDPLFARQLQQAADEAAAEFVSSRLEASLPCATAGADAGCARSFFEKFLPRAYRRPLEDTELDLLLDGVFSPAAATDGFAPALGLTLSAALQSAAFVYHTELGESTNPAAATHLTPSETASAIAYLITGAPPDDGLIAAAATLTTAEGRAAEARRLLDTPEARVQMARMVKEWLGVDGVTDVGKDKEQFPNYEALRPHMLAETDAFVSEVVFNEAGGLNMLLGADFTMLDSEMASFYGLSASGATPTRVDLSGTARRGILNHASFLARYATEVDSAPVHRGVAVGLRVMCVDPGDPTGLNIDIVPPQPEPGQTTRERFSQHTIDPVCAGCHSGIDGIGFTFEGFDAVGAARTEEHGKQVETATELSPAWARGLSQATFTDSADLAATLASAESVKRCFARHLARHAGATTNASSENYFLSQWEQLEQSGRDSIITAIVAYISSDVFVERSAQGGAL